MLSFSVTADAIAATPSTLEKTRLLAGSVRDLPADDLPADDLRRAAIHMGGQPYGRAGRRTLELGWAKIGRVVEASGLTDAEIAATTEHFLAATVADQGRRLVVEPSTLPEVAFDAIQRSARHESGFAMRLPRIVRLRPDKPASDIDTLARVEELYERHLARSVALAEVAEVSSVS